MGNKRIHRKRVKRFHEPGDVHELTFSCYRRMQLLTNDKWREHLARSIDRAAVAERFRLTAFVFMPEHVHLLAYPDRSNASGDSISRFLAAVKRPVSARVKADLEAVESRLLKRLTIAERPGKQVFRFWQEGPGYDRNLNTVDVILNAIDYIHLNPVRRGLVARAADFRWSSARWHLTDGSHADPALPKLHRLPAELFLKS